MAGKKDWGLVLAGGGGKGAYEIGAWKALLERPDLRITAVSGTSVGALNAGLFAIGDYAKAEEIWREQINDKVILSSDLLKSGELLRIVDGLLKEGGDWLGEMTQLAGRAELSIPFLKKILRRLIRRGVFTREGLIQIFHKNSLLPRLKRSRIPCYVTCYNMTSRSAEYFYLQQYGEEEMLAILLASSALPFIFPPVEVGGEKYWDGGLKDNVPIRPLYDAGYRKFLVVHLDRQDNDLLSGNEPVFQWQACTGFNRDNMEFCDAVLVHFYPKKSLSGIMGTLDFNPGTIVKKLNQGYEETRERLERIADIE